VRLDAARRPIDTLELICPGDADAMLLAGRVGPCVEVWEGERRLGLVGEPADAQPNPEPDEPRAFNPFRPAAWRRLRRPT
jgi:hypothetical protein